jgi:putative addiction module component (TIGR02574 family)
MTETLQQLIPQIERLSTDERAELAHYLLESLGPPDDRTEVDADWKAELTRRREEMMSGKVAGIPGDQVIAELREEFP